MTDKQKQLRNICFTINNYTEEETEEIKNINYKYVVLGFEKGEENGIPHIQGYMELKNGTRLSTLKKHMKRAHIEERRGKAKDAANYCKKGEQTHKEWHTLQEKGPNWGLNAIVYEKGEISKQGERKDLKKAKEAALEGGMRKVTEEFGMTEIRVAEKYLTYNEKPRNFKPSVKWVYGPTGSGKSKKAREITGLDDLYTKNDGTKWWDGYDGHSNVIIDDFRDSWFTITETLSLLDRYEKRVEYKGGWRQFRAKNIVITSLFHPKDMYSGIRSTEPIKQLLRRIDEIIELGSKEKKDEKPVSPKKEAYLGQELLDNMIEIEKGERFRLE